ncbi:MAG: helix-turn-helix transcriptional regulator [Bacillota bacterium]
MGRLIRNERDKRGFTQEALAKAVDLSRTSITNIELGRQRFPLHKLWEIARALGVETRVLLPERQLPKRPVLSPDIEVVAPRGLPEHRVNELINRVLTEASHPRNQLNPHGESPPIHPR